ncbi:MAG: hypothetical protein ACYCPQ_00730 [Elusimicrobiota bacterium]
MTDANAGTTYRFSLTGPDAEPGVLRAVLTLALRETEILFGRARLKLETSYEMSPRRPACTVEGGTECGDHLAKILSGFLIKQVGESGFSVERLRRAERKP